MIRRTLVGVGVLAAFALPATAVASHPDHPAKPDHPTHPEHPAKPKHPAKPHSKHNPTVAYKAKGVVKAVDAGAGTLTLTVGTKHGDTNKHARAWAGKDITFKLTGAHVHVNHDTNGDGKRDIADAKAGDRAHVLAKLPKDGSATEPYQAKRVGIKTAEAPKT